jgi:predicted RNA-binding protein with PIN domain
MSGELGSDLGHGAEVTGDTGGSGDRRRRPVWLVDGMNVIGSRPDRWWNDRDGAVRRLIGELGRFAGVTGDEVTVVFDRRPPDVAPGRHGGVEVAFASRRGRNAADHEIVDMVAGHPDPGRYLVVTSDRWLVQRVRELGAGVEPSSRFRRHLDRVLTTDPYR